MPSAPIVIVPVPKPLITVPSSSSSVAALAPVPTVMPAVTVLVLLSVTLTPSSVAPGPLGALLDVQRAVGADRHRAGAGAADHRAVVNQKYRRAGAGADRDAGRVPVLVFLSVTLTPSSVAPGPLPAFLDVQRAGGADRHCRCRRDRRAVVNQQRRRAAGADIDALRCRAGVVVRDLDAVERRAGAAAGICSTSSVPVAPIVMPVPPLIAVPSSTSSVAALLVPILMPCVAVPALLSVTLTPSSVAPGPLPVLCSTSSVPLAPIVIVPVPAR